MVHLGGQGFVARVLLLQQSWLLQSLHLVLQTLKCLADADHWQT
jgi:hypothetical protein